MSGKMPENVEGNLHPDTEKLSPTRLPVYAFVFKGSLTTV